MKTRHVIILGVIFVILFAALAAKKIFLRPPVETKEYASLAISILPDNIYAIEAKMAKPENTLRFERGDDGAWRIPSQSNIQADKGRIDELLRAVTTLEGELRSKKDEVFADYGISDEEAFTITLFDKEKKALQTILAGMKKPAQGGSFIRKGGSPDVFLTGSDVFALFGIYGDPKEAALSVNNWIDLSIAHIAPDEVESIKIVRRENDLEITTVDLKRELDEAKGLKRWVAAGAEPLFEIDAAKIKNFLQGLNDIKAAKYLESQAGDYGFDKPYLTASLAAGGRQLEFIVGKEEEKDAGDRFIKNADGFVFFARRYALTKLDVDMSAFFIDNPLKISKDTLQAIAIKSPDKSISLDKGLIEKNADYVNKLQKFSVEKLIFDEARITAFQTPAPYSVEIKRGDNSALILDVQKDEKNEAAGQVRGKPAIFTLPAGVFADIFENLDKLTISEEKKQ